MHRLLLLLILLTITPSWSSAEPQALANRTVTEIYRPHHRSAQQLIDVVSPLFADQARFSSDGSSLVMVADASTLATITDLLKTLDHPPRRFEIIFSNTPRDANTKTYATQEKTWQRRNFTISENEVITLVKQQQAQTVTGLHPLWQRVEVIPTQQDYLQLQLQAAGKTIYVSLRLQTLEHGRLVSLERTVSSELDQWISLAEHITQSQTDNPQAEKTYSTGARSIEKLYLKVTAGND